VWLRSWSAGLTRARPRAQVDPTRLVSGSDDGTVKLWSVHSEASTATIETKVNVCCVQFSPTNSNLVAFGSANYRVYLYDLRNTSMPLSSIAGHSKAVSYVRFLDSDQLVSASTDSTLRLWDVSRRGSRCPPPAALRSRLCLCCRCRWLPLLRCSAAASTNPRPPPAPPPQLSAVTREQGPGASAPAPGAGGAELVLRGHQNDKNFVGLSVLPSGYIACGSENNSVYCYYRSMPVPLASHSFASGEGLHADVVDVGNPFVSSVCWSARHNTLLAANSTGTIKVLALE
jgi:WD40 repeat protein